MATKQYTKGKATQLSTNFISTEFDCKGTGCCSTTKIDEKLISYLQQIRTHFGRPITINSSYRCATHNKRVGGAKASRHTLGSAADISINGVPPAEIAKYAESIGVLGIGLYETNSDGYFVHIDTRTAKSFWYGQKQLYRSTFGGQQTNNKVINSKKEEDEMTQEKFNEMMNNWIAEQANKPASDWSADARTWAENNGLITGDGSGKNMYRKILTREELVTVLYRALHRHFI